MIDFSEVVYMGDKAIRVETVNGGESGGIDIRQLYLTKDGEYKETRKGIRLYFNETGEYDGEDMQAIDALLISLAELRRELVDGGLIE